MSHRIYRGPKANLTVEGAGGANLGNCYNAMYFKVTSLTRLDMESLVKLREAGFLGYGQEFDAWYINHEGKKVQVDAKVDWQSPKIEPTGNDLVQCSEVDERSGEVIKTPSINPYTKKEDAPTLIPFYVYHCESRVDSSD